MLPDIAIVCSGDRVDSIIDWDFLMGAVRGIVLAIWSTWLFGQPAFAEKRVALVIGNSAYQNVGRLANPVNDSGVMSATFKTAGFDVVELRRDLKANEMRRALRDFSDNVRDADIVTPEDEDVGFFAWPHRR